MKKIKKILFPTDFSECANNAFVYALMMADKMEADIEVVHIVFPETEPLDFPVIVTKATEARIEAARESMKAFVDYGVTSVVGQLKNVPNIQSDVEVGVRHELCIVLHETRVDPLLIVRAALPEGDRVRTRR